MTHPLPAACRGSYGYSRGSSPGCRDRACRSKQKEEEARKDQTGLGLSQRTREPTLRKPRRVGHPSSPSAVRRRQAVHAYEIFPNIAGRLAPVAEGTLDARRFQVSYANRAKAAASFASEGSPNSSDERMCNPSPRSSLASIATKTGFFAPPPEMVNSW